MSVSEKKINTQEFSKHLRSRIINVSERRLLITRLGGSDQEKDFTEPANCNGYGRVRHFRQATSSGWPKNLLPIAPACKALGLNPVPSMMTAQVFQNAACNWRCWYCYVPYNLLSADSSKSEWLTPTEMVALYKALPDRPLILDLSGGSPDLVPEWVPWMMEELTKAELNHSTYLWSDDNLSTNYIFEYLSPSQIEVLQAYKNYGRVCCFKGYDAESFTFNTKATEDGFDQQFNIMNRLLSLGIDIYGYATLTTPSSNKIADKIKAFVDRLQELNENLPLRIVPLEIREFSPVGSRMDEMRRLSMQHQSQAIAIWNEELNRRFSAELVAQNIADIPLGRMGS